MKGIIFMRLRNVPGSRETIADHPLCFLEEDPQAGNCHIIFGNDNPIRIEVGMGKGQFITTLAQQNPNINYIGIEKYSSVLVRALEKTDAMETQPENLRFIRMDAENICNMFAKHEVDGIYLNFSDPWPPNRQRKRRLTWRAYLEVYDEILRQQGDLCFKTDNQRFFEWSLQEICQFGWLIQNISLDLHNSDFEGNVMTEYEEKFSAEGYRIYRLEARRRLPEFLKK